jgi:hypothetical protein
MLEHAANVLSMGVKAVFARAACGAISTPHHRDKESARMKKIAKKLSFDRQTIATS